MDFHLTSRYPSKKPDEVGFQTSLGSFSDLVTFLFKLRILPETRPAPPFSKAVSSYGQDNKKEV